MHTQRELLLDRPRLSVFEPTLCWAEYMSMLPKCFWDDVSRQGRNPASRCVFFRPHCVNSLPNQQPPEPEDTSARPRSGAPSQHPHPGVPLNISCHACLSFRVSDEKSDDFIGIPLYVIFCFSLVTFNIFFFDLIFISFINVSACCSLGLFCLGLCGSWT